MINSPIESAVAARRLVRASGRATLATALAGEGWPYGSLVMVACAQDASPLLLVSELSEHTRNLASDPRASLLFDGSIGLDVPLTGLQATVLGPVERRDEPAALGRYVRRHPDAETYLALDDFHLYRMTIERAHVVAGFGAIDPAGIDLSRESDTARLDFDSLVSDANAARKALVELAGKARTPSHPAR